MIEIRNLSFSYLNADGNQKSEDPQLSRVNLKITQGEFVLVCGPTGSGKSTFLKTLNGLAPSFTGGLISGELLINGLDLLGSEPHEFSHLVGYVNQQPEGAFVADLVLDEIVYSAEQLAVSKEQIALDVERLSKLLDLEDLLNRPLATLSGGQQQRVAVARALASQPHMIFADEPTGNLDSKSGTQVLDFMRKAVSEFNQTIVMVTHDPNAASYADRVVFLADGKIVEELSEPTTESILGRMARLGD
jgi:energy-coupling factor transporter ATP-binding protein EcfA2